MNMVLLNSNTGLENIDLLLNEKPTDYLILSINGSPIGWVVELYWVNYKCQI